jgi:distribution and morphology protein 34
MSFVFPSWETAFSPAFHEDAKAMLEGALNKVRLQECGREQAQLRVRLHSVQGNKPPVIQGRIEVVELSMGTQPPTLTLLEIGDLSLDRFRGILRLGYQGDAWLEVRCRVQANPLSHNPNLLPSSTLPLSTPLLASQPLLVPMTLRLSKLHLRAILILVVSASKGITLVFKNDPLQNVDVSSTFDSVEVIRGYLQQEIEGQLREMFREDLPGIIHRLSQRWFTGTGVGGKVEMPYRENGGVEIGLGTPGRYDEEEESIDSTDPFGEKPLFPPHLPSTSLSSPSINVNVTPRRKSSQQAARPRRSSAVSESPTSYTVFPDIEDYDPTYGLRPEGLPTHSGYEAFGRLWEKAREGEGRGLGSLMSLGRVGEEGGEEEDRGDVSDGEWDETGSFDLVELDESLRPLSRSRRTSGPTSRIGDDDLVEWETFPAVGGGTITRPRVYHSQSQIRAPSEAGGAMPSPSGTATGGSITARASSVGGASSTIGVSLPFLHQVLPKLISVTEPTYRPSHAHFGESLPSPSRDAWTRPLFPPANGYLPIEHPPHLARALTLPLAGRGPGVYPSIGIVQILQCASTLSCAPRPRIHSSRSQQPPRPSQAITRRLIFCGADERVELGYRQGGDEERDNVYLRLLPTTILQRQIHVYIEVKVYLHRPKHTPHQLRAWSRSAASRSFGLHRIYLTRNIVPSSPPRSRWDNSPPQ